MTAIRALMAGLVDYAGLFPPASLNMVSAVRRYREYLTGDDRWALGRFVVSAGRLKEFTAAFNEVCCEENERVWSLSVLASGDTHPADKDLSAGTPLAADATALEELEQGAFQVESVELKAAIHPTDKDPSAGTPAGSAAQAERALRDFGLGVPTYVEFAPAEADAVLPVLARFGARAKIRTGGVTAEAIPTVEAVAGFLAACARAKVPFKATAGLHHAVRDVYNLTYDANSARATMHGFVNVFLAAVLAWRGEEARALVDTLNARDAGAFAFGEESVRWLKLDAGVDEIEAVRRQFAISYGSCSFAEPVEEARALGWL